MNWDDIDIDDTLTHNSRYFFANYKCAKVKQPNAEQEMAEMESLNAGNDDHNDDTKTNNLLEETFEIENKENKLAPNAQLPASSSKYSLRSTTKLTTPVKCQDSNEIAKIVSSVAIEEGQITSTPLTDEVDEINTQMDKVAILTEIAPAKQENQFALPNDVGNSNKNTKSKPNIMTPSKWAQGAVPKTGPQPPRACQYQTIYDSKHEELLRKQREEQRKMREFRSRPAPNYRYKPLSHNVHFVTMPLTPKVLKRSKESERKRSEKLEELKRKDQPQAFKAIEHNALKEKAFVPKKEPLVIEQRPYNLRCERRLQERKKYDQAVQRAMEEKQKQEEERRKQEEEEQIKEIRKATKFKARPNPFKN